MTQLVAFPTFNWNVESSSLSGPTIPKRDIMVNVKEHVNNGKRVKFKFFRNGTLYYRTERGLLFEIPSSETGDAVFKDEDKALLFMRWIRRQLEANEKGRAECS